jgi:hypothetical protein
MITLRGVISVGIDGALIAKSLIIAAKSLSKFCSVAPN